MTVGRSSKDARGGKWISAATILALGALTLVIYRGLRPWRNADSQVYLDLAQGLASGHFGRSIDGAWVPEGVRPPGYPAFLALTHGLLHLPPFAIVALQLVLALTTCWWLQDLVPREHRGFPLYALVVIYPAVLGYAAMLASESLSIAVTGLLLLCVARTDKPDARRAAFAGLLCGLAVLIRPNLVIMPLVPFAAWWATRHAIGRQSLMRICAAFAVAYVVITSPMIVFNTLHHGRPSPLAVPGSIGTSLYLASWEDSVDLQDTNALYWHVATERARRTGLADDVTRLNTDIGVAPLTAPWSLEGYPPDRWMDASKKIRQAAIAHIRAEPVHYLRRTARAAWALWCPTVGRDRLGRLGSTGVVALWTALWLGGLCGAVLSLRRGASPAHRAVGVLVLAVAVTQPWLHLEGRYTAHARIPLLVCFLWFVKWVQDARAARRSEPKSLSEAVESGVGS